MLLKGTKFYNCDREIQMAEISSTVANGDVNTVFGDFGMTWGSTGIRMIADGEKTAGFLVRV